MRQKFKVPASEQARFQRTEPKAKGVKILGSVLRVVGVVLAVMIPPLGGTLLLCGIGVFVVGGVHVNVSVSGAHPSAVEFAK